MPTYEYACRSCGEHLEVVQSFKDDALTVCPNCQGELRKVFSAAGIIFKGSGWHIKDYATTSGSTTGAAAGSGSSEGKSSEGGSATSGKDGSKGTKDSSPSPSGKGGGSSSSSGGDRKASSGSTSAAKTA